MNIQITAIGNNLDSWVEQGIQSYLKRFNREFPVTIKALPAVKRHKNASIEQVIQQESQALLDAVPKNYRIVALDERGKQPTTRQFSQTIERWRGDGDNVALLIGGADGLSAACRQQAQETLALSSMTLPHALARLLLVEQVYRAWSLLQGMPYHRD